MSALKETFSKKSLRLSWKALASKFPSQTSPGVDGQTRKDFAENLEDEIAWISKAILENKYRFSKLRAIAITKSNGKTRLINVPTIRDRFVQRILIQFFKEHYSTRWKIPNSFSSMGGDNEGTHDSLKKISQELEVDDYVIRADLSQFFDTIDRVRLIKMIKRKVPHRSLHNLIVAALASETDISTDEARTIFIKSSMRSGVGIRQGMPISPVLAFLFLEEVDRNHHDHMFRYVDDMIFYDRKKSVVESYFNKYRESVEAMGLTVHPLESGEDAKTKLFAPNAKVSFLGIDIVRRAEGNSFQIPSRSKRDIKERALSASKFPDTERKFQKKWLLTATRKVSGLIRDYRTAYNLCENWPAFEKELKQTQIAMCRNIAVDVSKLSRKGDKESTEKLLRAFGISG